MKKEGISVVLCDFACRPKGTVDTEKIAETLSRNELVGRVVRLPSPCRATDDAMKKVKSQVSGGKVLVAGCPLLDGPSDPKGFSRRVAEALSLNPGDVLAFDVKSAVADLYGAAGDMESAVLKELAARIAILSGKEPVTDGKVDVEDRTLVYGSGVSGLLAALELARGGVPVDIVETPERLSSPGCLARLAEDPSLTTVLRQQVLEHPGVVPLADADAVRVECREAGFEARSTGGDGAPGGAPRAYGSIVFAPERLEQPAPLEGALNLTELYGRIQSGYKTAGTCVFLSDYGAPTSAEVFRDILEAALRIHRTRAAAVWVLLQNVQVCLTGQEELYGRCREEGIVFVKYSGGLSVVSDFGDFTITGTDAQTGFPFQVAGPETVVIPGAPSLSNPALAFAASLKLRLYGESYSQPDSLWRLPNESNIPGVFTVGAARGNKVLEDIQADASSVAVSVIQRLAGVEIKESIPIVDTEKCVYCLTCVRVCPFGAMMKNPEEGVAAVNPAACQSCGVCIGECPAEALRMRNLENDTLYGSFSILSGQEAG